MPAGDALLRSVRKGNWAAHQKRKHQPRGSKERFVEGGLDGEVSFGSKTKRVDHFLKALGATQTTGNRMYIGTENATTRVKRHFSNFFSA